MVQWVKKTDETRETHTCEKSLWTSSRRLASVSTRALAPVADAVLADGNDDGDGDGDGRRSLADAMAAAGSSGNMYRHLRRVDGRAFCTRLMTSS